MDKDELFTQLTDKNEKAAYEIVKRIIAASAQSDEFYCYFDLFLSFFDSKNSYLRTRGFCLICAQAKWDKDKKIEMAFDKMKALLNDEKPTVVRQCISALHGVVLYLPDIAEKVTDALNEIDLTEYSDSMAPLIKKDIDGLLACLS